MAAKKLPTQFPAILIKTFGSFQEAYQTIRDMLRSVERLRHTIAEAVNEHADRLDPVEDSGAPSTAPSKKGLHYINTSNGDVYYSVGTSNSSDWKKLT